MTDKIKDMAWMMLSEEDKRRALSRERQTSTSHPMRIDWLPAGVLGPDAPKGKPGGRLGMTFCPGKKDSNGFTGNHDRDLRQDLDVLQREGTNVLVSLMEDFEYTRFKVARLFRELQERKIRSIRFPVQDVSVPDSMSAHALLVEEVFLAVRCGDRVVAHCKGGLGRTGVLVASVLVYSGMDAKKAIDVTRATRTGTVQTTRQEEFVAEYAAFVQGRRFEDRR
jgi:ADP-ribosyl-[dinitrogen reductase] hydrolase